MFNGANWRTRDTNVRNSQRLLKDAIIREIMSKSSYGFDKWPMHSKFSRHAHP